MASVKLSVTDSNPIISFKESSSLVPIEAGYDTTNNRYIIGMDNVANALDNPKFTIEEIGDITFGGATPLKDSTINTDASGYAIGDTSITVSSGAKTTFVPGDLIFLNGGQPIGVITAVPSDTAITIAGGIVVAIGASATDLYIARDLHDSGFTLNMGGNLSVNGTTLVASSGSHQNLSLGTRLFKSDGSPIGAITALLAGANGYTITAAQSAVNNGDEIYIDRANPLIKACGLNSGVNTPVAVNKRADDGYPVGTKLIVVDGPSEVRTAISNEIAMYNNLGQLIGHVDTATSSSLTFSQGIHVNLAENDNLFYYLQPTGVKINNVGGYIGALGAGNVPGAGGVGHTGAMTVDGTPAYLAFRVGDKVASSSGRLLGYISDLTVNGTSITLADDITGALRYSVADDDELYKITGGQTHVLKRTGDLYTNSGFFANDVRIRGRLKLGLKSTDIGDGVMKIAADDGNNDPIYKTIVNEQRGWFTGIDQSDSNCFKIETKDLNADNTEFTEFTNSFALKIDSSNNTTLGGTCSAVQFTMSSDRVFKKNIEKIENPLDIIDSLRGVTWNWKKNDEKSSGVIAQELQNTRASHAVRGEQGNMSVDYPSLSGYFIEAIKMLNDKIKNLEDRLKGKLE